MFDKKGELKITICPEGRHRGTSCVSVAKEQIMILPGSSTGSPNMSHTHIKILFSQKHEDFIKTVKLRISIYICSKSIQNLELQTLNPQYLNTQQ